MTRARIAALALAMAVFTALPGPAIAQADRLQEANQLFKQGQLDRALAGVNEYLASRPKDARGRFLKGLILTEQKKPAEAIKVFTSLTEDFPELPEPYNNLAVLYASQGQYDKARSSLEMAIRTHPSYATAHENLGDIYAKMASQAYDKALQLDQGNTAAQTKLNMIRELFTPSQRPAAAKAEPAPKVATGPASKPPSGASRPAETPAVPPAATPPATPPQVTTAPAAPPPPAAAPAKPVPQAPAPAAKAAPPGAPAAKADATEGRAAVAKREDAVIKTVQDWAKAWSNNDVKGYLAHYAPDFLTPKGMSRSAWEAQRKARIAKPKEIQVDVESPSVKFEDEDRAIVTFMQHYRSNTFRSDVRKRLVLVKSGDKWLIKDEDVGG